MNSRFDFYIPSSDGKSRIHGIQWVPDGAVRAVIQISHGMIEHIGRYDRFAGAMNRAGIAVIGHDHLGHGLTAREGTLGVFSEENGAYYVLEDLKRISDYSRRQYPALPHILMGHSMGSFFARRFLTLYGDELDGVILMGTGSQPSLILKAALRIVEQAVKKQGRSFRNERLHHLVLGSYNKRFEKGLTGHQWLSRVEEENRKYEADPYCQFLFSNGAYEDFFRVMWDLKKQKQFERIPKTLPVYLISGEMDPVGENGKGVRRVYQEFKKLGMRDVEMKLYPGARHEILNEVNRGEVCEDVVRWVERCAERCV